jgi:Leucine-rich repeat (LRR) protein
MRKLFVLYWLSCGLTVFGQEMRMYDWEIAQFANPDTVFAISLTKQKLESLPENLKQFTQLKKLDLSKNKLKELPAFIGDFTQLEELDLSKNSFTILPLPICKLTKLKRLLLGRNQINQLPACFQYCEALEELDMWDNPLHEFPEALVPLKKLKKVDLQGVMYGPTFQQAVRQKLKGVEVLFDAPCDCME